MNSFRAARVAPEERIHRPPAVAILGGGQGEDMATKMSYGEQLKHPYWQRKRLEILNRANFKCECCGDAQTTLHVHHKRYVKGRMAWEYEENELTALCEACHQEGHDADEFLARLLASIKSPSFPPAVVAAGLVAGFGIAKGFVDESLAEEAEQRCAAFFTVGLLAAGPSLKELLDSARAIPREERTELTQRAMDRCVEFGWVKEPQPASKAGD